MPPIQISNKWNIYLAGFNCLIHTKSSHTSQYEQTSVTGSHIPTILKQYNPKRFCREPEPGAPLVPSTCTNPAKLPACLWRNQQKASSLFFSLFNRNILISLLQAAERVCYRMYKVCALLSNQTGTPIATLLLKRSNTTDTSVDFRVTLCIFWCRQRGFNILSSNILTATHSLPEETHWSTYALPLESFTSFCDL